MNINKILKDIELEIISRAGISSSRNNSTFELLWAKMVFNTWESFVNDLDTISEYEAVQNFKDNCVNEFMILHHNNIVKKLKFNWLC